uniref:Uncharacterized protein n=1 Tax=Physcomitrium patens TaxID=3218 RepID=A0A2K1JYC8_PHYPA|nr:hypothetical protein PHYPA_013650 [Physcomitrium patens]
MYTALGFFIKYNRTLTNTWKGIECTKRNNHHFNKSNTQAHNKHMENVKEQTRRKSRALTGKQCKKHG